MQNQRIDLMRTTEALHAKAELRRDKRLWKPLEFPCTLEDVLSRLTKDELTQIRKNYEFKKLSALNKQDMAVSLAQMIPLKFKTIIYRLDQYRYDLIRFMVNNNGIIPDMAISLPQAESLVRYSLAYPGFCRDQKILCLPLELMDLFAQEDSPQLQKAIKRNTEWVTLTHGILYHYGLIEPLALRRKLEELTGKTVEIEELIQVMTLACDFFPQARLAIEGYVHRNMQDAKKILLQQRTFSLGDYPFTKAQLLEAGDPDYVEFSPEMDSFMRFMLQHFSLTDSQIQKIATQAVLMIKDEEELDVLMAYLQTQLGITSAKLNEQLKEKLILLSPYVRRWGHRGYAPTELD